MTTEREAPPLPETPGDRARALAELSGELALTLARASAKSLFSSADERDRVWPEAHRQGATLVVRSLGRLRGAAAKIGQMLAQRPGALPDAYVDTLAALTDDIPPMSFALVKAQIESELGDPPSELFASFERAPLAAASLGQVHAATTHEGERVAVKVQYPGVADSVRADLTSLRAVIPVIERAMGRDDLQTAFEDVGQRLAEELDYRREAENVSAFRALFEPDEDFVIPSVLPSLSTGKVLTLERVEGTSLRRFVDEQPSLASRERYCRLITRFMCTAVFRHGVLHVDPNPGNYLFRSDGRLGVVDFGAVKRFSTDFVGHVRELLHRACDASDDDLDEALLRGGLLRPAAATESRKNVRALARAWSLPIWKAGFAFDRAYVDEVATLQNLVAKEPALALSSDWLFWARQMLGLTFLLHKLGCAADLRPLFEEHLGSS